MTQLLHRLRLRSSAISRGLLLVLMAGWLSLFCMPCDTQADAAPINGETMPCHGPQAPDDRPDTCPHGHAGSCLDGNCGVIAAIPPAEPSTTLLASSASSFVLLPTYVATSLDEAPALNRPEPPGLLVVDPRPLYLRHCCFLN